MSKNYREKYDTFNELHFRKILDGGSLADDIYRLRKMAKDCIRRASIVKEASNAIEINNAMMTLLGDKKYPDAASVLMREIDKKYDLVHDDLFIIAAFENFAKAELLSKRYIVHKLSKPSGLARKQRTSPIHINTVRSKKHRESIHIEHQTISVNQLLQPEYIKIIGLTEGEIYSLRHCRSIRNGIHFGGVRTWGLGNKLFEGLIEFGARFGN